MPKTILGGGAVLLICASLIITGVLRLRQTSNPELKLKNYTYVVEVAATPEQHQKGLSNRSSLAQDAGMLFEFDTEAERCFWMKDMRFSIDIIWVDASKRITRLEHNLSPDTYPRSYCADAQYVVELNAGEAAKNGLKPGDRLDF